MNWKRDLFVAACSVFVFTVFVFMMSTGTVHAAQMLLTKTATCGCCKAWEHNMRAAGILVQNQDVSPVALHAFKKQLGVPPELAACHTAQIGGYFIEGHVSATEIIRLLAEAPAAKGLVVPGMPMGSPGMGPRRGPYNTLLVQQNGTSTVYARH